MNLFQACIRGDSREAITELKKTVSSGQPEALWAIMMHAAAWHEEREFDTPHSTIITYAIHRMIEDLGTNTQLLDEQPERFKMDLPEEFLENLQLALLQKLTVHLSEIDHYTSDKGPRYDYEPKVDSLDNVLHSYALAIRKHSHIAAFQEALTLANEEIPIRFIRRTVTLASEDADRLGHAFIMPMSLVTELPTSQFSFPHRAGLWHLTEYLVGKVPSSKPDGLPAEKDFKTLAKASSLKEYMNLIATSTINYGILGHNAIFAHRIIEASQRGLINQNTTEWLLNRLKQNIASDIFDDEEYQLDRLLTKQRGTDWETAPSVIELPHSQRVRDWLSDNTNGYWSLMMDLKSKAFEKVIQDIGDDEWDRVRAAQYAMCTINGAERASHVVIFTQALWSLVDKNFLSKPLAALQVHRMLRQYLKGR